MNKFGMTGDGTTDTNVRTGSEGDGMDEYEAKGPIHRLDLEPGWGEHPGIGPLGLRGIGTSRDADAQRGRVISSSGRANHACRRVAEVLNDKRPDLVLILDLWEDPRRVPKPCTNATRGQP
jgi:hypothetical protein